MSVRIIGPRISLRNQAYQLYFRRNYTVKYLRTRLLPSNPFLGGLVGGFVGVGSIVLTGAYQIVIIYVPLLNYV